MTNNDEQNQTATDADEWLKPYQAAHFLLISKETLRQLYKAGDIPYYQPSKGIILFRRADLEEYRRKSFRGK